MPKYVLYTAKRKVNLTDCKLKRFSFREKRPNTELFLVRIFPHSDLIRRNTLEIYGAEITPYLDTFHAVDTVVSIMRLN